MKSKQRGYSDRTFEGLFSLVVILIVLVIAYAVSSYSCSSRWKLSGLKTDYGVGQGCLVQMPSGRWVPEKAVRDVDLGKVTAN